jgi:hypothetical protein
MGRLWREAPGKKILGFFGSSVQLFFNIIIIKNNQKEYYKINQK